MKYSFTQISTQIEGFLADLKVEADLIEAKNKDLDGREANLLQRTKKLLANEEEVNRKAASVSKDLEKAQNEASGLVSLKESIKVDRDKLEEKRILVEDRIKELTTLDIREKKLTEAEKKLEVKLNDIEERELIAQRAITANREKSEALDIREIKITQREKRIQQYL